MQKIIRFQACIPCTPFQPVSRLSFAPAPLWQKSLAAATATFAVARGVRGQEVVVREAHREVVHGVVFVALQRTGHPVVVDVTPAALFLVVVVDLLFTTLFFFAGKQ